MLTNSTSKGAPSIGPVPSSSEVTPICRFEIFFGFLLFRAAPVKSALNIFTPYWSKIKNLKKKNDCARRSLRRSFGVTCRGSSRIAAG